MELNQLFNPFRENPRSAPVWPPAAVQAASQYLSTTNSTFATAADGDALKAAILQVYPDHSGPFLLQLSIDETIYPAPGLSSALGQGREARPV